MVPADSKSHQLRVRVTSEERDRLEKLRLERERGETISLLVAGASPEKASGLTPGTQRDLERLAVLLKREPRQVEEACVEGILELIEMKCEVPLIVMETHLHLKYRGRDEKQQLPWADGETAERDPAPQEQKTKG